MDRQRHIINGDITVFPNGDSWIAYRSFDHMTRIEFLDLEVDTLRAVRGWFQTSNRIAGLHTSRIRDTGIVFDIDGRPPERSVLYIESDNTNGLALNDLINSGFHSDLVSRLLFRTAFSLNSLGNAFCRHNYLSSGSIILGVEGPALSYPRSYPRSKIVNPMSEFKELADQIDITGNTRDAAIRYLEDGIIPENEENWVHRYHAEPTSWLLGMEERLAILLESIEFIDRNGFRGLNVVGRVEWGAGILARDFCISRRLLGDLVIQETADSLESLSSKLSIRFGLEKREIDFTVGHILRMSRKAPVSLVVNTMNRGSIQEKQQMVSALLELADAGNFRLFVFSDTDLGCDRLFRITIPFQRARKRGLLSRITSGLMDRTPAFFGKWLSAFEYYQLIVNCKGDSALNHMPRGRTSFPDRSYLRSALTLQGAALYEDADMGLTAEHCPFLITGYVDNYSVWIPEYADNAGKPDPDQFMKRLLSNGCGNLRELNWILDSQAVPALDKSLLLNRYLSSSKNLVTIEDKLIMIGKIVFSGLDQETADSLVGILPDISDSRRASVLDLQSEMREYALKIADAMEIFEVSVEKGLMLEVFRICASDKSRMFAHTISICRSCIELHNPGMAAICITGLLADTTGLDEPKEAQAVLTELMLIADSEEQKRLFETISSLISIQVNSMNELIWDKMSRLASPNPVDFSRLFAFRRIMDAIVAVDSEAVSRQKARLLLSDARFIASLNRFMHFIYATTVNEISMCKSQGNLSTWEIEERVRYAMAQFQNRKCWDIPVLESELLADASLQQMNLSKADNQINKLMAYWKNDIKTVRKSHSKSQHQNFDELVSIVILIGLATDDLNSIRLRLGKISDWGDVPKDFIELAPELVLSRLDKPDPRYLYLAKVLSIVLDVSSSQLSVTELRRRLNKLREANPLDVLANLRRGDLLSAYVLITRIASSGWEKRNNPLKGRIKVIRALERRYRDAGLPLIEGATPLEALAGSDWAKNLEVKRTQGRIPVPDDLEALKQLLNCDAVWLFEIRSSGYSLVDKAAPVSFPDDVSWLNNAIEKIRLFEPYEVVDIPGSGWAAGHASPATSSVKMGFKNENPLKIRIMVTESICPGNALTYRQKVLLSDYAISRS
ncbi:MAG: hypothetical protein KAR40_10125 [Candidatus Sabulitectum sp.]|nr:hypothetical protein [Candidatus Sabulitectum sp.]